MVARRQFAARKCPSLRSPQSLRAAWLALSGLSAVFLIEMLDHSVLNLALPTIGRQLGASATELQWVTGVYSVVFGGLMLVLSAIADRVGRRRMMLIGLVLLGLASLGTVLVSTSGELIAIRAVMGLAAAMTTPGSTALAFRLFGEDELRVRAMTVISTVGLVGLAIGPIAGGFVLAVVPWQVLLLVNVPVALFATVAIRIGIPGDVPEDLHRDPVDIWGSLTGTGAIIAALVIPTLFVNFGVGSWVPWVLTLLTASLVVIFVVRELSFAYPLLELRIIARPLVSSGLAFKAAANLAVAGTGYMITLQLQLDWGWTPARAAIGMLPQVVVLIVGGSVIGPLVRRLGLDRTAWVSATAVVCGLAIYALFGRFGYPWIALSLVLIAAGMRMVGVVSGNNVMRGVPPDRTTVGAALVDTSGEIATGVGIALCGTILATMFTGRLVAQHWTTEQTSQFHAALTSAATTLTFVAAALVGWGIGRARRAERARKSLSR